MRLIIDIEGDEIKNISVEKTENVIDYSSILDNMLGNPKESLEAALKIPYIKRETSEEEEFRKAYEEDKKYEAFEDAQEFKEHFWESRGEAE